MSTRRSVLDYFERILRDTLVEAKYLGLLVVNGNCSDHTMRSEHDNCLWKRRVDDSTDICGLLTVDDVNA